MRDMRIVLPGQLVSPLCIAGLHVDRNNTGPCL